MSERVNLSELGRRLGHNKGYIHKLKSRGVLEFDASGLIDIDEAIAAIAASRDPAKLHMAYVNERQREKFRGSSKSSDAPPPQTPFSGSSAFVRAQTARAAFDAKLKELAFHQQTGKLVDAEEVSRAAFALARQAQENLMAIPDRVSAILAAEDDPARVHDLLTLELTRVCNELARDSDGETRQ